MGRIKAIQVKIRPDVESIIGQSDEGFQKWYSLRREATERLLKDYELFASIPHLAYEEAHHKMDATAVVSGQLESLREGLEFLEAIKKAREGYRPENR